MSVLKKVDHHTSVFNPLWKHQCSYCWEHIKEVEEYEEFFSGDKRFFICGDCARNPDTNAEFLECLTDEEKKELLGEPINDSNSA